MRIRPQRLVQVDGVLVVDHVPHEPKVVEDEPKYMDASAVDVGEGVVVIQGRWLRSVPVV